MAKRFTDTEKLLEKHIENLIYKFPRESLPINFDFKWIGRQVPMFAGVADLIGLETAFAPDDMPFDSRTILVIEVKNVPVRSSHIVQLCRYSRDIETVIPRDWGIRKILVTRADGDCFSANWKSIYECDCFGVELVEFCVINDTPQFWVPAQLTAYDIADKKTANSRMFEKYFSDSVSESRNG